LIPFGAIIWAIIQDPVEFGIHLFVGEHMLLGHLGLASGNAPLPTIADSPPHRRCKCRTTGQEPSLLSPDAGAGHLAIGGHRHGPDM
jgi:hypothetical protein